MTEGFLTHARTGRELHYAHDQVPDNDRAIDDGARPHRQAARESATSPDHLRSIGKSHDDSRTHRVPTQGPTATKLDHPH